MSSTLNITPLRDRVMVEIGYERADCLQLDRFYAKIVEICPMCYFP